jgi:hypothetical protein
MAYQPDQRKITSQVLTTAGWLKGTFHVLRSAKFVEQLNVTNEFFRLTDVSFIGREQIIEFFAVQRAAVTLIVPPSTERDLIIEGIEELVPHHVFMLFDQGYVEGRMMIRKGVRISDFLVRQSGSLRDGFFVEEQHPSIVVNASKIVGVSETSPF